MNDSNNEPSLEKIDDYNGNESNEKKNTIIKVIIFCLVVGAIFTYFRITSTQDEYVGTSEKPGINTTKLK